MRGKSGKKHETPWGNVRRIPYDYLRSRHVLIPCLMQFRHLFLLLAVAAGVRATTVEPPTFSQLVAEADSIYRGHVTAVEARRVQSASGAAVIKTFVTFAVDRAIKGASQTEVVLQFL